MWFHLVKACAAKTEGVSSPSVDLTGCSPPKDLIKQDERLAYMIVSDSIVTQDRETYHVIVVASHLVTPVR